MQGLGSHVIADYYDCDRALLDDLEGLRRLLLDAVARSGATIVSDHFKAFEPHGVTGVVVIAESHITVHTWPEHGFAAVDYFTCGTTIDPRVALAHIAEALRPGRHEVRHLWRGEALAGAPHKPPGG